MRPTPAGQGIRPQAAVSSCTKAVVEGQEEGTSWAWGMTRAAPGRGQQRLGLRAHLGEASKHPVVGNLMTVHLGLRITTLVD